MCTTATYYHQHYGFGKVTVLTLATVSKAPPPPDLLHKIRASYRAEYFGMLNNSGCENQKKFHPENNTYRTSTFYFYAKNVLNFCDFVRSPPVFHTY